MTIFRIHIRPTGTATSKEKSFPFCLRENILGFGWQVNATGNTLTWDEYEKKCIDKYTKKCIKNASYLKRNVKINDLIWTRDLDGRYYLGKVLSEWEYLSTDDSKAADIVNIVRCDLKRITSIDDVPGKVIACFRPSRTLQAVRDETTEKYTKYLWNKLVGEDIYVIEINEFKNVFSFLNSKEIEDVFLIYLQTKGWIFVPNSRKTNTMKYEFYLIHKCTKKRAVVQVKSGHTPLDPKNWSGWEENVFLFQANGNYREMGKNNIKTISPEIIKAFMKNNNDLLPKNILHWWNLANEVAKIQG